MKKLNNQTGSAHVIIIIILITAIIGLLGFVFWQNFIDKKVATTAPSTTTTTTSTTTTTPAATGFTVSQWSIKIPTSATDFIATVPSDVQSANGIFFLDVTTAALKAEAAKENCNDSGIGSIYRATSLDGGPSFHSAKVESYYYGFNPRSQAACVDAKGIGAEPLNTLMMTAEADLKAVIINTTAY